MTHEPAQGRQSTPGRFKVVGVVLVVQALLNVLAALVLRSDVNDRLDHGQEVANKGLVNLVIYLSFAVALAQVVSALLIVSRFVWVRWTIVAVEGLTVLFGVVGVFSGAPQAAVGVVIAGLVIGVANGEEAKAWFNRRHS